MSILDKVIGPVVGGLFGLAGEEQRGDASAEAAQRSAETAEKINQRNIELQREFAQHGVRWRVEDAKAAGLHPLYALNSGGASYTPTAVMGAGEDTSGAGRALSEMGQNLSRAMMAQQTQEQREIHIATLKRLEAETGKDEAMGAYYRNLAAGAVAAGRASPGMAGGEPVVSVGSSEFVGPPDLRPFYNQLQAKPIELPSPRSDDSSITTGIRPGWMEIDLGAGLRAVVPEASSVGEAMESVSESAILMAMMIGENQRRYGPEWTREALKRLPVIGTFVEGRQLSADHMKSGWESPDMGQFDEFGRGTSWLDEIRRRARRDKRGVVKWPYK